MDVERVRAAHADAWERHGVLRRTSGGDAARLPGIRLMASGLPHAQWNNGDVSDPASVDIEAVRVWYAAHLGPAGVPVPWGVRVPRELPWPHGRHLFAKRLMGLSAGDFSPAPADSPVTLRAAGPGDVDAVLAVDTVAFEESPEVERPWVEPMLDQPGVTVCVAEVDGQVVACGNSVRSDGDAGPALYVAGIGVLPGFRRRGIGAAVSSYLVEHGLDAGAELAHLHPDTAEAARIYARLGFIEVDGFDVYVDLA